MKLIVADPIFQVNTSLFLALQRKQELITEKHKIFIETVSFALTSVRSSQINSHH